MKNLHVSVLFIFLISFLVDCFHGEPENERPVTYIEDRDAVDSGNGLKVEENTKQEISAKRLKYFYTSI